MFGECQFQKLKLHCAFGQFQLFLLCVWPSLKILLCICPILKISLCVWLILTILLFVWPILTILLFVWPSLTILLCVRPILPSGVGLSFRFSPESRVEISILGTKLCWILVETALVKDLSGNSSCCERCEASLLCPL